MILDPLVGFIFPLRRSLATFEFSAMMCVLCVAALLGVGPAELDFRDTKENGS